ncbi:hypothetical protein F3Y22_tig00110450pilonHSYRG00721 [Hibiscus syriacus]|uniref:Uncharacterized protein n=1 Tax=Hibiscus syriacus TaxID=106335 RepID=A0A6A3AMS5_HIBSY|nr:hypothetical protein F3Y22_tig00110450pilonHSYRG00721 [Hibiscus syriacus]
MNRSENGHLTLKELKRGNLIDAMLHADEEEDINKVLRYGNHALTYRIVDRIFSQVSVKFSLISSHAPPKVGAQRRAQHFYVEHQKENVALMGKEGTHRRKTFWLVLLRCTPDATVKDFQAFVCMVEAILGSRAMKLYTAQSGSNKRVSLNWINVLSGGTEYGYYVCKFMKEIDENGLEVLVNKDVSKLF